MKKYPLCFWNYATFDQMGEHPVKDWVDAGFGMALSPAFRKGTDRPEQMLQLLDECEKNGISVIIDDKRCRWNGVSENPEAYKAGFCEMLSEFGKHPAVYGFYVGDEPGVEQSTDAVKAIKIQKEFCPEKKSFLNFFPYWDGIDAKFGMDYDEWIHEFVTKSGLDQISYDCYDQLIEEKNDETFRGLNFYYNNLRIFRKASETDRVPMWVTNLAIGHFQFRIPTEDDFRWQLNTSVACGANSVWWFFLYYRLARVNYRLAPIDEYGNRTEAYTKLARIQNIFQHQFGELFTNLIHEQTQLTGITFGGYPLFEYKKHPFVKSVGSAPSVPGLISDFHAPNGDHYIVLVNNSQKTTSLFTLNFKSIVTEVYRVAYKALEASRYTETENDQNTVLTQWGSYEVNCVKNDVANNYRVINGEISNDAWLAPGQMEVYRIVLKEQ